MAKSDGGRTYYSLVNHKEHYFMNFMDKIKTNLPKQIKTIKPAKCFKKNKVGNCKPMSFALYKDKVFCAGYVTNPKYNKADIVRLCLADIYVGDFTPDEALTIVNILSYTANEAILSIDGYNKWREECFKKVDTLHEKDILK
ncbi:MAG: hypothetical protein AB1567_04580 [bacterium]